nr:Fic/DOC family N-terminal domain-containing protein [Pseudomonas benzenivorans]
MPPAAELGTRAVLKRRIEARAVLAELKQAAELIPNQRVPINTIPLLDAKDSSEIESLGSTPWVMRRGRQCHPPGRRMAFFCYPTHACRGLGYSKQ